MKIACDDSGELHRRVDNENSICINEGRVTGASIPVMNEAYVQVEWQDVTDDFPTSEPKLPEKPIT
ncbi:MULTISPECIES: hypothetical protein [Bacillaceae]|uniref:hypothetical protein n=1 Tax=Bacillaceae TaxID=186817 RepID=UPI00080ACAB4|nr:MULTISPECIES: hypothetical protein [Bacillaceae]OCA86816.1 hypothetical protein A8L44_05930 [Bacillus sp. FJAT-27986]